MRRNPYVLRTIALFLVFTLVFELLFPSVAYALTGGPTTPEVFAHQPADATDNVSLVTGDFNYTIPITSIPEYPMAVGYNGQAGMDQDAGIFGFGVNGFSGAIARSMQGLPDDLNNGPRRYQYSNQKNWNASVGASFGIDLLQKVLPVKNTNTGLGVSVSPNVSLTVGYDNFKGMFGALSLGVSAGLKITGLDGKPKPKLNGLGLGIGAGLSSDYGAYGHVGLSYKSFSYASAGTSFQDMFSHWRYGLSLSMDKDGNDGINQGSVSFDLSTALEAMGNLGISQFSSQSYTTSQLASLSSVVATTKSFGVSLTVPIPVPEPFSLDVTGSYYSNNYGNLDQIKNAYGFLYLNGYDRRQRDHLADMAVEGENSYDGRYRNNPSYLQRDFFVVNAQGFSGSMQLYQDQYGTVSRNYNRSQSRQLGIIGLKTERKEVEPWTNVARATINKQSDILKLLKKSDEEDEKDFDNTLFIEQELLSLTTENDQFNKQAGKKQKFKMRGDLAGEFNLASKDYKDYQPNQYNLEPVSGSGDDRRTFFLGEEKSMPMYAPQLDQSASKNYNKVSDVVRTSSDITYQTVGEVLGKYPSLTGSGDPLLSTSAKTQNDFKESFLSHLSINATTTKKDPLTLSDDKLQAFNLVQHLKNLRGSDAYVDNLIADIRVRNAEGITYLYTLPAFNKSSKVMTLSGKGQLAPKSENGDYYSFQDGGKKITRNKSKVIEEYKYPYAWLLTAIVGPDYIDFDAVPGPSEGDLGYWVKFKYVKAADNYRWRTPFIGMMHNPGAIQVADDDTYSVSSGEKEIYYIYEIESSNYLSKYTYEKRFDGIDAGGTDLVNGEAHNSLNQNKVAPADPTGSNSQYAVTRVELYKKHFEANSSTKRLLTNRRGKLLKATEFKYDYSICPATPNNITNYGAFSNILVSGTSYHVDNYAGSPKVSTPTPIGTGKLTLRKVQHIAYESGVAAPLPSYEFKYGFDNPFDNPDVASQPEYNPAYDGEQLDQWGNYARLAKWVVPNAEIYNGVTRTTSNGIQNPDNNGVNPTSIAYYNAYTELDKLQADKNAQAFKLAQVFLPGGGKLNVDFEASSYGAVQDTIPYVMRKVQPTLTTVKDAGSGEWRVTMQVDVTDLQRDGKALSNLVNVGDSLYGELSFYESHHANFPRREDQTFTSTGTCLIHSFGTASKDAVSGRWYQAITVKSKKQPTDIAPYVTDYIRYRNAESDKMRVIKESINGDILETKAILHKYETLEKDEPIDALRKVITNVRSYFVKDETFEDKLTSRFGDASSMVFSHQSYLRTPVYKAKYTGSRVKSIAFTDNFQYATQTDGTAGKRENKYITNYYYDELGNGQGRSEGVATIEPGGGKSCVVDVSDKLGAGFMPSPSILSAKTTVELGYGAEGSTVGDKISRKKGKTEYHFYTPKDSELTFKKNFQTGQKVKSNSPDGRFFMFGVLTWLIIKFKIFKKKIIIRLPLVIPLTVRWRRYDNYHARSYAYLDQSDMYGKPKRVVQLSAEGNAVSQSEFNYFGRQEGVKAINGPQLATTDANPLASTVASGVALSRPGRMDQTWSESYFTKESHIELIPWIQYLNAKTERNFSYTNMKYTYLPPVLKEVVSTDLTGTQSKASYTAFDYFTGQPLESRSTDSYGNTKIQQVVPAYWKYPQMGPSSEATGNLNMLTQATGTYKYLNEVNNSSLLGVGIVEWSQDQIRFQSGLRNQGKQYPSATEFYYSYEQRSGTSLETVYNQTNRAADAPLTAQVSKTYIDPAAWLYKPYRTYTFETTLNPNGTGTLESFAPYIYASSTQDNRWKLTSTNTLFNQFGSVVESKDILDKYATAHFGYNFAHGTASVSNATWAASAYASAENTYANAPLTATYLDDDRVSLGDAQIMGNCARSYLSKTFVYNTLTTASNGRVLNVTLPASLTTVHLNVPFAKLDLSYSNAGTLINRSLYVSLNENRQFKMVTERGESFTGFYASSLGGGSYKLALDGTAFTSVSRDATYPVPSGYTVAFASENLPACLVANKTYSLPANDCIGGAHTGNQAFVLRGNAKKGTRFEVPYSTLPVSEKGRSYKAMVWVHTSSPANTTLVADNGTSVLKAVSTPYLRAGNWSLLRLELSPAEYGTPTKLGFYVQCNSASGTVLYDDFRVLPLQAGMDSFVYDAFTGRITAKLDNENLATFFIYDNRGRLIETKTEVENLGVQTVKKYVYNEQKKN